MPGSAGRGPAGPDRVERLIAPVTAALGMDLESVRVTAAGRRRLLRVVVDKDGGVSLDEVAHLSRELSAALDASGVMGEMPYTLEVSSPGVGRPLTQPRHWRRAAGRLARVHVASSGTIQGRVVAADEAAVILDVGGEHRRFGYPDLGPGEVLVEFGNVGEGPVAQEPGTRGPGAEPDGH
ncbi:MAG TPA: ribosome maturation factor RimP [Streptosporangiaceae bacterium]|nr:ribosome maturation factor RimP [Streptosporangiaceae bacterium]